MKMALQALNDTIKCPECGSDALYRYGKTPEGQQKYQCILCDRQFSENSSRNYIQERPPCPECGAAMHVYMRTGNITRFRCSEYPKCKTFVKTVKEE